MNQGNSKRNQNHSYDAAFSADIVKIFERLRLQHEHGDQLALLQSIYFCGVLDHPLPKWALSCLARAIKRGEADDFKFFRKALFENLPRGGPHANPVNARHDKHTQYIVNAAIDVVRDKNYSGNEAHKTVREILKRCGIHRALTTIDYDWKHRSKYGCSPPQYLCTAFVELINVESQPGSEPYEY